MDPGRRTEENRQPHCDDRNGLVVVGMDANAAIFPGTPMAITPCQIEAVPKGLGLQRRVHANRALPRDCQRLTRLTRFAPGCYKTWATIRIQ